MRRLAWGVPWPHRTGAWLVVLVLGLTTGLVLDAPRASAASLPVTRIYGSDAIGTSIAVSEDAFPAAGSANAVVLARSDFFADALAGGPLAAAVGGPLLITQGADQSSTIDPRVLAEIQRVLPVGRTVYILGGDLALSPAIDTTLQALGYVTQRIAGTDEFATAVDIAEALGNPTTIFEATGLNFQDALSAVPAAIAAHGAILLTDGSTQAPETAAYLAAHPQDVRYAIGGPLAAYGADPGATPVYGQDLYGTSAAVASTFFPAATVFGAATGTNFPDALSGGVFLGQPGTQGPMLLVPPSGPLPETISGYLASITSTLNQAYLFGGPLAVSDEVLAELEAAAGGGTPPPPPAPTPLTVTTAALPQGTVGTAYSATLSATGGTPPYSWTLASGSLPPGLTLSSNGSITGTPTSPGDASFTVQVTDSGSPTPQVASQALSITVAVQVSTNWSGYVVSSSQIFTEVSGTWTVPSLDCAVTPTAGAAIWVGIGGVDYPSGASSGVLLQTGVTTDCVDGVQQDTGWWEEYPSLPSVSFASFTVSPGDTIQATVFEGSGAWETRVDDLSTDLSGVMVTGEGWGVLTDGSTTFLAQGSTADLSYSGGYTAEWIVEDYALSGGALVPFADYGTVSFSGLTTNPAFGSLTRSDEVEMEQGGVVLSTPSAPSQGGFSVSYTG
jgi:hypothetical protein